jgi:NAD-dependent deacetylase
MFLESKSTVVLTGAGISTESGIPDFRSPGTGLWEKMDPMEALSTEVLYNNPKKFYNIGFKMLLSMRQASPNKAHYILADMEEMGLLDLIVTQNIDNLHQKAGSKKVYEVHGNTRTFSCDKCGKVYDIELIEKWVQEGEIPPICECKGIIRPDVVLFGDMLPQCFYDSVRAVENADLLVVIGSSLSVAPVNQLAAICRGLIIINIGETFYDYKADIVIREKISKGLEEIMDVIKGRR